MIVKKGDSVDCKYLKTAEQSIPGMGYDAQVETWGRFKVEEVGDDYFIASNGLKYYFMSYGSSWIDIPKGGIIVTSFDPDGTIIRKIFDPGPFEGSVKINTVEPVGNSDSDKLKDLIEKVEGTLEPTEEAIEEAAKLGADLSAPQS